MNQTCANIDRHTNASVKCEQAFTLDVADAVSVRVLEAPGIHVVNDARVPPVQVVPRRQGHDVDSEQRHDAEQQGEPPA